MSDAPPTRRPRLRLALSIAITAALVAVLVRDFGRSGGFVAAARAARPAWVLAAFVASCACVALGTVRWQLVLRAMGHELGFWRGLTVVLAAWPLAVVTPSRANELLRPLAVLDVVPLAAGAGSVLAEKVVDLFVLLALAAAGAALAGLAGAAAAIAAVLGAEVVAVWLVVRRRAWLAGLPVVRRRPQTVDELFEGLTALGRAPARLAVVAGVSLLIRVLTVAVTHFLLVAVGADVPLGVTVMLWPAAMLVGVAPLTLGGVGTRDAAFLAMLAARGLHVDEASVLVATMGYSAVAVWSFAVIGLPFMARESARLGRR